MGVYRVRGGGGGEENKGREGNNEKGVWGAEGAEKRIMGKKWEQGERWGVGGG